MRKVFILFLWVMMVFPAFAASASAACGISNGNVSVLANDFPALHVLVNEAEKCSSSSVTFKKNHNKDHKDLTVASLTPNPAEYTSVILTNASIVPLLNEGLLRPLDDYVARYGQSIGPRQLLRVDGKVMAIAFMANAQHLFYRRDILSQAGVVKVPSSYEEILVAAKAIKAKGLMKYPIAGTYKAGWNLAEEFINMYMGLGGDLFKSGSAEPNIRNGKAEAALEMMKSLSVYMNPDFLTHDSNAVQAEWQAGKAAITNLWGSRAAALLNSKDSSAGVAENTYLASPPTVGGGSIPASTLWWDGFSIAKNVSETDAVASFRAMTHGASAAMADKNPDAAVWIIDGHASQSKATIGVRETALAGARPYPMVPYIGILHSALGAEIVSFMQGNETASKALQDVDAAYRSAAKEAGFL